MSTKANAPQSADALVVGGGSAGATLAARLSEDPSRHVLLLEVGPVFDHDDLPAELTDADSVAVKARAPGDASRRKTTARCVCNHPTCASTGHVVHALTT